MTTKLGDLEEEVATALLPEPDALTFEAPTHAAGLPRRDPSPILASAEFRLLYLPTMLGVYTARHQRMPESDEALREHVFGGRERPGCYACREETEFLVAHQRKFF